MYLKQVNLVVCTFYLNKAMAKENSLSFLSASTGRTISELDLTLGSMSLQCGCRRAWEDSWTLGTTEPRAGPAGVSLMSSGCLPCGAQTQGIRPMWSWSKRGCNSANKECAQRWPLFPIRCVSPLKAGTKRPNHPSSCPHGFVDEALINTPKFSA